LPTRIRERSKKIEIESGCRFEDESNDGKMIEVMGFTADMNAVEEYHAHYYNVRSMD
jgi:hypothetical protein